MSDNQNAFPPVDVIIPDDSTDSHIFYETQGELCIKCDMKGKMINGMEITKNEVKLNGAIKPNFEVFHIDILNSDSLNCTEVHIKGMIGKATTGKVKMNNGPCDLNKRHGVWLIEYTQDEYDDGDHLHVQCRIDYGNYPKPDVKQGNVIVGN